MSDVSRHLWIVCAPAVLLPGNNTLATQPTTSACEIPDTKDVSAEHRDARGGPECVGFASSKKQNQLLQTRESVKVFSERVSPALLLSQPPSWQNDCRGTAALGQCAACLGCPQ